MKNLRWLLLGSIFAALTAGCSGADAGEDDDDGDDDTGVASEELSTNASLQTCADPGVLLDQGKYFVTCTGGGFPIYANDDAHSPFTKVGQVFGPGQTPKWADGNFWAPEIHHVTGGFVAYFTARNKANGKNAIGAAFSKTITGPYVDRGAPLIASTGSKIDSHMFSEGGAHYLYWKAELFNSSGGQADIIRAQRLTADGLNLAPGTEAKTVLSATEKWEAGVVEAPWVIKRGSWYYMFYAGAYYCNSSYGIGAARSKSPMGPFTKDKAPMKGPDDGKILGSGKRWVGPGHNAVVRGPDGLLRTFFHAYKTSEGMPACGENVPKDNNKRHLLAARVVFKDGWPQVQAGL
jgi:beta-xylosidase